MSRNHFFKVPPCDLFFYPGLSRYGISSRNEGSKGFVASTTPVQIRFPDFLQKRFQPLSGERRAGQFLGPHLKCIGGWDVCRIDTPPSLSPCEENHCVGKVG